MKKTILIPTDFSIESLNLFKEAAQSVEIGSVNIIFLHCVHLSDSIFELLFFSKKDLIDSLINPDFNDACKIIRNKYSSHINSALVEIFSGLTQTAFQNFLEGHRVDEIYVPKNYTLKLTDKRSFDPMPFIQKATVPVTEVYWKHNGDVPEKNLLAELFIS